MNILLLFFALPISTIILAIVLQKVLKCPILVAATFFAIYLIVAFAIFDSGFLILVILYTILAYVTAVLTRLICNIIERINQCERNSNCNNNCDCSNNLATVNSLNNNCSNNMNENTANQTRFTLTTNQANPVVYLTNRNNTVGRNGCCCGRR